MDSLLDLFGQNLETLPAIPDSRNEGPPSGDFKKGDSEEWLDDPVPLKLEKIRAAFLNAKTAREVTLQASLMQIGDWLEMVAKLSPKNVQVKADFSFKHMLEELGPIDREAYRLPQRSEVIDVEAEELLK